jgi:hypothetical protein
MMNLKKIFPTFFLTASYLWRHCVKEIITDKRLFYPFLLAAYPVLFQYSKNWEYLSFYDVLPPLIWSLALAYILLAVINTVLRDNLKSAVIVSLLLTIFFSYGQIYQSIRINSAPGRGISHNMLLTLLFGIFFICVFLIFIFPNVLQYITRLLQIFSVLLLIFIFYELSLAVMSDIKEFAVSIKNESADGNRAKEVGEYPDIYYIILDSYSGEKALKDYYDFDNSGFTTWLKKEGFVIPENAHSNYCQTTLSLPSSLNMDYIDSLMDISGLKNSTDRSPLKRLMAVNALSKFLKDRGYTIVKFVFGYAITDAFRADITDQPAGVFFLHEFTNHVANTTMLICFQSFIESEGKIGINIRRIMSMLEGLPIASTKFRSPKFVFAHILCPHPPFVFDKNGPTDKYTGIDLTPDYNDPERDAKIRKYKKGYLGQIEFLNNNVNVDIDRIIRNSKKPPIIILQADHGSGTNFYDNVNKTNLNDRFSILNAYYLPYGGDRIIYNGITPVNSFREILNYYFGADFKRLPDRSYFSPYSGPYNLYEITGMLKGGVWKNPVSIEKAARMPADDD